MPFLSARRSLFRSVNVKHPLYYAGCSNRDWGMNIRVRCEWEAFPLHSEKTKWDITKLLDYSSFANWFARNFEKRFCRTRVYRRVESKKGRENVCVLKLASYPIQKVAQRFALREVLFSPTNQCRRNYVVKLPRKCVPRIASNDPTIFATVESQKKVFQVFLQVCRRLGRISGWLFRTRAWCPNFH